MIDDELRDVEHQVATGSLPRASHVEQMVAEAHDRFVDNVDGSVADYIPVLAAADPAQFGIAIADIRGRTFESGDAAAPFSIQSVSKPFVYALMLAEHGHVPLRHIVGVNNTGLSFNSVMALELNHGHPMNPMVNAGAIATTSLVPGDSGAEKWEAVRDGLSAFAGRTLRVDDEVYRSESASNDRNEALGHLLKSYGRLDGDPAEMVDIYTRQCSLTVTAHDIAIMGATLADGGVNPVTRQRVVSAAVARDTLAVVASTGLYERSGEWMFEIGVPAKSGVSGGIVAMAPGKGAIGAFSPRLDFAGNSVRSQLAIGYLARTLGLDLFASSAFGGSGHPSPLESERA